MSGEWQVPSIAELLDAARLLGSEMVWDPSEYPNGPAEAERPLLYSALGVLIERMRGGAQNPATMPHMAAIHADSLDHDAWMIAEQAAAVLTFHATLLDQIEATDGACKDAASLARTAASILACGIANAPYQRVRLISLTHGGRCACGEEH